jgi:cytochrome c oxidase assembly protein subunit 15
MEFTALVEYSHRLSASLLGVLVLAMAALAWRTRRDDRLATVPSTIALALVVVAALLGAITVLTELEWWIVLVHLGIAELLVACLVVASLAGWRSRVRADDAPGGAREYDGPASTTVAMLVGTFGLILLGSYMVGLGYGSACATWPLCRGELFPIGESYAIHMLHRYVAGAVGVLIAWTALAAWSRRRLRQDVAWASIAVACAFAIQMIAGAALVWSGFALPLRALHLGLATLLWTMVVLQAALVFLRGVRGLEGIERGSDRASRLEGAAS